jgi:hypothetical protein
VNKQQIKQLASAYYERTGNRDVPLEQAAKREALRKHGALINSKPATTVGATMHLARLTSGGREPIVKRRRGADGRTTTMIAPAPIKIARSRQGHAPRPATNERSRGSRRGERATSSSSDDPDPELEPHRTCGCGCGASLDHLRSHASFLNGTHRMRTLRALRVEQDELVLQPIAAAAITRPCSACRHSATSPDEDGDPVCVLCGTLVGTPSSPNGYDETLRDMVTDAEGQSHKRRRKRQLGLGRWGGLITRLPSDPAVRAQPVHHDRGPDAERRGVLAPGPHLSPLPNQERRPESVSAEPTRSTRRTRSKPER